MDFNFGIIDIEWEAETQITFQIRDDLGELQWEYRYLLGTKSTHDPYCEFESRELAINYLWGILVSIGIPCVMFFLFVKSIKN